MPPGRLLLRLFAGEPPHGHLPWHRHATPGNESKEDGVTGPFLEVIFSLAFYLLREEQRANALRLVGFQRTTNPKP